MKIALGQIDVKAGLPERNIESALEMAAEAEKQKADLLVLPEEMVMGYLVGDEWESDDFCRLAMSWNKPLIEATKNGLAIAWGNVFLDDRLNERVQDDAFSPNEDGRVRKYNGIYVFQNGKPVKRLVQPVHLGVPGAFILPEGIQPKTLLPNYREFDDKRHFYPTLQIAQDFNVPLEQLLQPFLISTKQGETVKSGFVMCEDMWCREYRKNRKVINPTKIIIENGAELIANLSASPWTWGKNGARDRTVEFLAKDCNGKFVPFYYVNAAGAQNNGKNIVTFDGSSTIYDAQARPVMIAEKAYVPALLIADHDKLPAPIVRTEKSKIWQKMEALIRSLRHMPDMTGSKKDPKLIVGISGGIDSAFSTALACMSVGPENVIGVNMPTVYNYEDDSRTIKIANAIAKNFGIGRYLNVPIQELSEVVQRTVSAHDPADIPERIRDLNDENIQAKIRGTDILTNLAQRHGALLLNNGNKLETFLGYATLYGDVNGAIALLGDMTKTEIVEGCKAINDYYGKEMISEELFPDRLWRFAKGKTAPSAQLKKKQLDPMKFGYHCALVDKAVLDYVKKGPIGIMQMYIDGTLDTTLDQHFEGLIPNHNGLTHQLMQRWDVTKPEEFMRDLDWFTGTHYANEFKRVQSPPIPIVSKTAMGFDRRASILPNVYRKILTMSPGQYELSEVEKEVLKPYFELKDAILRMKEYTSRRK